MENKDKDNWGCSEEGLLFPKEFIWCPYCHSKLNNTVGCV